MSKNLFKFKLGVVIHIVRAVCKHASVRKGVLCQPDTTSDLPETRRDLLEKRTGLSATIEDCRRQRMRRIIYVG